jgi:hypothetical protein
MDPPIKVSQISQLEYRLLLIIVGKRDSINLKDIWPSSSGLRDHRRTILKLELDGQMSFKFMEP